MLTHKQILWDLSVFSLFHRSDKHDILLSFTFACSSRIRKLMLTNSLSSVGSFCFHFHLPWTREQLTNTTTSNFIGIVPSITVVVIRWRKLDPRDYCWRGRLDWTWSSITAPWRTYFLLTLARVGTHLICLKGFFVFQHSDFWVRYQQ